VTFLLSFVKRKLTVKIALLFAVVVLMAQLNLAHFIYFENLKHGDEHYMNIFAQQKTVAQEIQYQALAIAAGKDDYETIDERKKTLQNNIQEYDSLLQDIVKGRISNETELADIPKEIHIDITTNLDLWGKYKQRAESILILQTSDEEFQEAVRYLDEETPELLSINEQIQRTFADMAEYKWELANQVTALFFVVNVAVFGLVFLFLRRSVNPLKKVTHAIDDITRQEYTTRLAVRSEDEIGMLCRKFNTMAEMIQQSTEELKCKNKILQVTSAHNDELLKTEMETSEKLKTLTAQLRNIRLALDESNIVSIADKEGTITYVNDKLCQISKYSRAELIGKNHRIVKSGYHPDAFFEGMWKTISKGLIWRGEIKNRAKDGTFYWVKTMIMPVLDKDGKPKEYVSIRTDITDRKGAEEMLQESRAQLKAQYEKQKELTKRLEEVNQELIVRAEKLREIDIAKEEFSSMITHELKTPLVPIQGYCELLLDGTLGALTQEQREKINTMYDSSLSLSQLIQDVLDVHKLELGKMTFDMYDTSAKELIDRSLNRFKTIAEAKSTNIVDGTDPELRLKCDPERILQVISNLVSNALKFTPEQQGRVEVCAKKDGTSVLFIVKDNGMGIPKQKQQNLFKKFYQVDASLRRSTSGTGLGLAICKGIVEAHNGKIWLESAEGKGSAFYFLIPVRGQN
jgi:PAS domain S-box-containing protein